MPRIAYVNGKYVPEKLAAIALRDRGFGFSDGVYEVIALMEGRFVDEDAHFDRMERSLGEIRMGMPMSRAALKLVVRETARRNRNKSGMIYIQVTRGAAKRNFALPEGARPTVVVQFQNVNYDLEKRKKIAKKAITVPDLRWQRCDIKTNMMLAQVLARDDATRAGADDAWMVDEKGFITEATAANAWIVDKKGTLITRPAAKGEILKGVTRLALHKFCRENGIKYEERLFTVKEAEEAAEAFTSAATALIVPIVSLNGKTIGTGRMGPVTEKLMDFYWDYALNGGKPEKWTP